MFFFNRQKQTRLASGSSSEEITVEAQSENDQTTMIKESVQHLPSTPSLRQQQQEPEQQQFSDTPSKSSESIHSGNLRYASRGNGLSLTDTNLRNWEVNQESLKNHEADLKNSRDQLSDGNSVSTVSSSELLIDQQNEVDSVLEPINPMESKTSSLIHTDLPMEPIKTEPSEIETRMHELSIAENNTPLHRKQSILNDLIDESKLESSDKIEPSKGSAQMRSYRYLKHMDLKAKILDLCRREQIHVVRQSWDEALRLRNMRNIFMHLKNKNLYECDDVDFDEEEKKAAQKIIDAGDALIVKRKNISNALLYR